MTIISSETPDPFEAEVVPPIEPEVRELRCLSLSLFADEDVQGQPARLTQGDTPRGSAVFSPCQRYRYSLTREWDPERPRVCFVMLNPSTADETRNDPTIKRCIDFARRWGCGSLEVLNLFAWRSTDPKQLQRVDDPIGNPENDRHIARALRSGEKVVCAWGKDGKLRGRGDAVIYAAECLGVPLYCLAVNQCGSPKHPLYIAGETQPVLLSEALARSAEEET